MLAISAPTRNSSGTRDAVPELRVLIDGLTVGDAALEPIDLARQSVWLPPLPDEQPLVDMLRDHGNATAGTPVGLVDDPTRQRQYPLLLDPAGDGVHVACVGAPARRRSFAAPRQRSLPGTAGLR